MRSHKINIDSELIKFTGRYFVLQWALCCLTQLSVICSYYLSITVNSVNSVPKRRVFLAPGRGYIRLNSFQDMNFCFLVLQDDGLNRWCEIILCRLIESGIASNHLGLEARQKFVSWAGGQKWCFAMPPLLSGRFCLSLDFPIWEAQRRGHISACIRIGPFP